MTQDEHIFVILKAQSRGLANHIVSNKLKTVIKMAKEKNAAKSAAEQAAAKQAAPANKTTKQETAGNKSQVSVIQLGDLDKLAQTRALSGLDPNHTVDLLKMMHETYRLDPAAAQKLNISQDSVDKINRITAIGQVAILTNEIMIAQTPFAVAMRVTQLEAIKEVAPMLGVTIDTKALPAPKEDGTIELPSEAVKVSKEAQKAVKEEQAAAAEKVELDPTKIEKEEDLKKSLLSILVKGNGSENLYDKIVTAINFYEAYLSIQANKAEDPDAAREALKKKTRADFLLDISHLLGKCTFTIGGIAKFMYENTERTQSPVVAFCTLRDASLNTKTGMPQIEDQMVADIVKVLIRWYADTEIITTNEMISNMEKDLEILKKDEKKNAKGIESGKKVIENAKKHIDEVETVVTYVNMPDRSTIDNFPANYTDNKAEGFKMARMIGSKILKSYYGDVKIAGVKMDSLVHNLQQYVGVITNMFLPPLNRIMDYSEANIGELEKAEEAPTEEPKN